MGNLILSPLVYSLTAGFLLSVAVIILLAIKKPFKKYATGIILFASCAVWIFFYILELISPDLKFKILWSKMQYLGISTVPATFFILVLYFAGYIGWTNVRKNFILYIIPVITLVIVFTNELHGLLWKQTELIQEGRYFFLDYKYGWWFWISAGHSYLLLLISYIILFRLLFKKIRIFKLQAITLICAILVSWIANILYLLEMLPLKEFDITPLALTASCIFITWGINFFKTGDFIPIEITQKIDNSKDFSIVTDLVGRILYISPLGESLLGVKTEEISGKTSSEMRHDFALHLDNIVNRQDGEIVTFQDAEKRFFKIRISPLVASGKSITGKILILRDITEQISAEKALKESEKKYRNIFENLIDGIFSCSPDGRLLDVNPALMKILGYDNKDEMFLNKDNTNTFSSLKQKTVGAGDSVFEVQLIKKDGSRLWVEISSQLIEEDDKYMYWAGVVRDIDEKKKSDEKITFLNRHDSFTGLYNRYFFEEELKRFDKEGKFPISIIIADINGLKLINGAFGHSKGDEVLLKVADKLKKMLRKDDILSRWGGDEFSIILPSTSEITAILIKERAQAIFKKDAIGGLETSIAMGLSTKSSAGQSIWETIRSAEDNMFKQKLLERQSAHSSVIFSLERALEERNYETKEHVKRMKSLVENFGIKLGLENSAINDLGLLASLHDIGKIAIADNIVLKPASLTDEEYDMMKKHSEIGYKIANSIPNLVSIAMGILTHHERWDGKGYPLKLAGDSIPLNSRIIAIIDAFDAMTNDRPYRKALDISQAIDELNNGAGSQFDPRLVSKYIAFFLSEDIPSQSTV